MSKYTKFTNLQRLEDRSDKVYADGEVALWDPEDK